MKAVLVCLLFCFGLGAACDPTTEFAVLNPCDHPLRMAAFVGVFMREPEEIAELRLAKVRAHGTQREFDGRALDGRNAVDLVVEDTDGRRYIFELPATVEDGVVELLIPRSMCDESQLEG